MNAAVNENVDRIFNDFDFMQKVVGDNGHHYIQLQLAGLRRQQDRQIAADSLETDHVEHFSHDGINLAGHYRRSRLKGRQGDFGEAGLGPELRRRRSLAMRMRSWARHRTAPESSTKGLRDCIASK